MARSVDNIRVDAAVSTGAVSIAPKGTALPTATSGSLAGYSNVGIIGADAIDLTPSQSSTDVEDMNGNVVLTIENGFKTEFSFPMLETNLTSLQLYHDKTNVTKSGSTITVQGGAPIVDHHVVVVDTISNGNKQRIVFPDAKITGRDAVKIAGTAATSRKVTLTAYPFDGAGHTYTSYTEVDDSSSS